MIDPPADPGFRPISPNPYIVGNPVRDRSMFFGREAEFDLVRSRFQDSASHGGLLLVFCGERRSGKTSILFQILDRRLGPDFIPVLVDMQSMAVGNEIDFLTRVCEEVRGALGPGGEGIPLPSFRPDSNHYATLRKFVQEVLRTQPNRKLILLFDEYELFENKIDAGQLSRDALLILASLMENERLYLIFTGSQHIDQRRRDYWEKFLPKSHFKMISYLERQDAIKLIRQPVEGRVEYPDPTVDAIVRLTAGQPFYTQAICQSMVDGLNERRTHRATPEALAAVVDGLVNNPLPQMIFLWDALERDEKLVLALLAECLPAEGSYASFEDIRRLHHRRGYRLGLDQTRIAPALEKLFHSEMLLRIDRGSRPGYAFRMDLWRLWIRRQHSVWQVRRELGIPIRQDRHRVVRGAAVGAGAVMAVIALAWFRGPFRQPGPSPAAVAESAHFTLELEPADAMVLLDDVAVGTGPFRGPIAAGKSHTFRMSAPGYADTQLAVSAMARGQSDSDRVALRALLGSLRVATSPPAAIVTVDGVAHGPSPVTVGGLSATMDHEVEATLDGFGVARRRLAVPPNGVSDIRLVLEVGKAEVRVSTEPASCEIRLDGIPSGTAPRTFNGVPFGSHSFTASREGYVPVESTLVIHEPAQEIHLILVPEPPGTLIVQGDRIADIYVAGSLVRQDAQNSGPQTLGRGTYLVHVNLKTGEAIDTSLMVRPREIAVFDYSKRSVTRRPEASPGP